MSRITGLVNKYHLTALKEYQGDPALFRAKGGEARRVTVVLDVRDVQSFAGSGYDSTEGPVSVVDSQQLWFLMFQDDFPKDGPKVEDEIVFEQKAYQIVQVMDEVFGKVWTRVHEAELSIGAFREF